MNTLCQAVDDYLELRRALGFKLVKYGACLREFVSFLEQKKTSQITTALALQFAMLHPQQDGFLVRRPPPSGTPPSLEQISQPETTLMNWRWIRVTSAVAGLTQLTKAIRLYRAVLLNPPILKGNIRPCRISSSAIKFQIFPNGNPHTMPIYQL